MPQPEHVWPACQPEREETFRQPCGGSAWPVVTRRGAAWVQAFYAALPESDTVLTIDARVTIALLLRHGLIVVRTCGSFDDRELVVELYGLQRPQPRI